MQNLIGNLRVFCACLFCGPLLLSGCSVTTTSMVPSDFEVVKKYPYSVAVQSTGGSVTNPLFAAQIADRDFVDALSISIKQSGLFKSVTPDIYTADYILSVTMLNYTKPPVWLDFDVCMKTTWMLTEAKTQKCVWNETFETTYKAKTAEVVTGSEKSQTTNSWVARTNIREGIKRLSMANF
ncbi:MAG TPA: hypothetical protein VIJ25_13085 [Methylococcales bacterium]